MTIEQTLMRSLKSTGGLSHGRGISDSTLTKSILAMPIVTTVSQQVEDLCGVLFTTSEQHVDSRDARILRDNKDVEKFMNWFDSHDPFPVSEFVMSISTGILGDETINCHRAFEIGSSSLLSIVGKNFEQVKFARKNRVVPIQGLKSKVNIDGDEIPVNSETLFRRIVLLKKSDTELREYFKFELAPYPLSLFDETGMRKTPKSVFYDLFSPITENVNLHGAAYIVDGGFLLHRVIWKNGETFQCILNKYLEYIKKHYNQDATTVVFDGYPEDISKKSTKSAERLKRAKKHTAPDMVFNELMAVTLTQEQFLSNDRNKQRFITMISEKLKGEGFSVKQAGEDADYLIVTTAVSALEEYDCVVLVGEDTDLLIMLTTLAPPSKKLFFMKPGKGKIPNKIFSSNSFQHSEKVKNSLLFLHAFSGCDTTSSFYRQGKKKFVKLAVQNEKLLEVNEIFLSKDTHPDIILDAGQKFLIALYGGKNGDTLHDLRFNLFAKSIVKTNFNLASLPPTLEAARQNCFRVYLQIQTWLGNNMNPLDWGWLRNKYGSLSPIPTTKEPAPQSVLASIHCKCTKGCNTACSCRKATLKCSQLCVYCNGNSCTNAPTEWNTDTVDDIDGNEEMLLLNEDNNEDVVED